MTLRTLCELFRGGVVERPRPRAAVLAATDGTLAPALDSARVAADVERLYHFWQSLGARRGERALLWLPNRPEWAMADFSLQAAGLPDVPLYLTLGPADVRQVLESARPRFAVVGDESILRRLKEAAGDDLRPGTIVSLGPAPTGPGTTSWSQALEAGERRRRERGPEEFLQALAAARPEDVATILYTSGTTGAPKGVPLTHSNVVSNVLSCLEIIDVGPRDVALSFLPLCHIYGRMLDYCYWHRGACLVYVADPRAAGDVLTSAAPSCLGAVPRFFEKMLQRIHARARTLGPARRRLFAWAVEVGTEWVQRLNARRPVPPGLRLRRGLAHLLVYRKIRRALGGRLRLLISGGAPLPRETADALWALDLRVLQGYGLTETSPVVALNPPGRNKNGTVGPPIPGTEVRIAEDGEILVRGPGVVRGYYNDPEATRRSFTDGWFATGDVGRLDSEGFLVITDRKKELIATAGGKKVAPAPIERRLESDPLIAHVALIGDRRPFVSALVVPDFAALEQAARQLGVVAQDRAALVARAEVRRLYEQRIRALMTERSAFEQLRRFALVCEEWTPETGEITATLKVRRRVVEERYGDLIARMYAAPESAGVAWGAAPLPPAATGAGPAAAPGAAAPAGSSPPEGEPA